MRNEIYMNVSITDFGNRHVDCRFCESINDEPLRITKIELNKARQMMWELKLAGGRKTVSANLIDPSIVRRDVYIFLPN